jgi:NAD(P)-dependent dehydrogenase (short-subunit alcohol dehydrogenase family)
MQLRGKRVLITGAGSGIGEAGARLFLEEGAQVVASGREAAKLEAAAAALRHAGFLVSAIVADLSDASAARDLVNQAATLLGGLDVLWCNAGMMGPGEIEHLAEEHYAPTIATNLNAVMLECGEAIAYMRAAGGGSIVVTSSTSGIVGAMGSPIYSASKFGVIGWVKSLAQRVARDGIRVNAVCPGPTATPQMLQVMRDGSGTLSGAEYSANLLAGIPLGRLGTPVEVAQAALWLASDASSYVTGTAIPVDGGYTCR